MSTDEICEVCDIEEYLCDCDCDPSISPESDWAECPTGYYDPDDFNSNWDDALKKYYNG